MTTQTMAATVPAEQTAAGALTEAEAVSVALMVQAVAAMVQAVAVTVAVTAQAVGDEWGSIAARRGLD